LLGFGAVVLASGGFGIGFIFILEQKNFSLGFYLITACILFAGNIFIYILHLIVSLRFGKGVSIGLGIVESLLSALLATGLGQGRWQFIPCGWGIWFVSLFTQIKSGAGSLINMRELQSGILTCVIYTFAIAVFGCIWFWYWEGKKSEE
jgi:ABC-2 type transport system permease protein